jgi:phospholipid/cholesterol/gamma-HCH transport system substrate-binding protein
MKISNEAKIGFLAVITIVIFIWSFHFLKGRNILKYARTYTVIYDKIGGLEESGAVLLNGYEVGIVNEIYFLPDLSGRLSVQILMNEKFDLPLKTVAQIFSSDLMGTKAIRLILGKSDDFHQPCDTLIGDIEGSLQEQVSVQMLPLKNKAERLILSIDSLLAVIQNTFNENFRENFSQSFEHIVTTISNLKSSTYTLDTLITNEEGRLARIITNIESISTNFRDNNDELTNILKNFSSVSDSLAKSDIKSTINNLDNTLTQINTVLENINSGEGSIGMLLKNDTLYSNLEMAAGELNKLLLDMRENPKRYVHFSVFDLGRTVVVEEESRKAKKKSNQK